MNYTKPSIVVWRHYFFCFLFHFSFPLIQLKDTKRYEIAHICGSLES